MDRVNALKSATISFYETNPVISKVIIGSISLYAVKTLYKRWQYNQKLFNTKNERQSKSILITGCDTGFGNAICIQLNKLGYRVIATCLTQEAVNIFLSDSCFTKNESIAFVMDVTKQDHIDQVKIKVETYLNKTNSVLWGIVNNAGLQILSGFEIIPKEFDFLQRNVLLLAPINITRTFLPLLVGRKNYKIYKNSNNRNNGGRIVNISSSAAKLYFETGYGPSKSSLSNFTHALRMELSPKFGIWPTVIQPGGFMTSINSTSVNWVKKIDKYYKENRNDELLDAYEWNADLWIKKISNQKPFMDNNLDCVIDCVIHGLSAKYPKREYNPGWNFLMYLGLYGPWWIWEPLIEHFA
eukprot:243108_1